VILIYHLFQICIYFSYIVAVPTLFWSLGTDLASPRFYHYLLPGSRFHLNCTIRASKVLSPSLFEIMEFLSILVFRKQVSLCPGHHPQDDEIKIPCHPDLWYPTESFMSHAKQRM
jgi:hypothetical protein